MTCLLAIIYLAFISMSLSADHLYKLILSVAIDSNYSHDLTGMNAEIYLIQLLHIIDA